MTKLSLGQAAKLAGVSKSTISRALKSGHLSYSAKSSAGYEIEPSELFRVFPAKHQGTVASSPNDAARNTHETPVLEAQLDAARQQLRDREDTIADLRRRLDEADKERREAQARVVNLLSDQRPARRGFWARLFTPSPKG